MITKTIPSYLYDEYSDDVNLQAFVSAYNTMTQQYVDWFVGANLPIYTDLVGQLLDWVGLGLYGVARPTLQPGVQNWTGEFNTIPFNSGLAYNLLKKPVAKIVNDDIYKRSITWKYYKGDGQVFNFDWLKKRIIRFLYGVNGVDVQIASLYGISITAAGTVITININTTQLYNSNINSLGLITYGVDVINTGIIQDVIASANIFKIAAETGVLPLPFQFTYVITIT